MLTFRDVAHLYQNCICECKYFWDDEDDPKFTTAPYRVCKSEIRNSNIIFIKPYLRKINDVTIEEVDTMINIANPRPRKIENIRLFNSVKTGFARETTEILLSFRKNGFKTFIPEEIEPEALAEITFYLVSRNIDVFGLIENGQAFLAQ